MRRKKREGRILQITLFLAALFGASGCAPLPIKARDPGSASQLAVPLISEDEFVRILAAGKYSAAPAGDRSAAAKLSARLNDSAVVGITGRVAKSPKLHSRIVLVARGSIGPTSHGDSIQVSDFYVAAITWVGRPAWAILKPSLVLNYGEGERRTVQSAEAICAPRPPDDGFGLLSAGSRDDAAGLPLDVILNTVSPGIPKNGAGQTVDLLLYPDANWGSSANTFACAHAWPKQEPVKREPAVQFWAAPKSALLIKESDYLRLLRSNPEALLLNNDVDTSRRLVGEAAAFASASNANGAIGVHGELGSGIASTSDFLVVARDFAVEGSMVSAREYFVVPAMVKDSFEQFAQGLSIDFADVALLPDLAGTLCGPVLMPTRTPDCIQGLCRDFPSWNPRQGYYGGDRYGQGLPRTTVTWPVSAGPPGDNRPLAGNPAPPGRSVDIAVVACTLYEPPPPPALPQRCDIDIRTGAPVLEQKCDGKDDNCNGKIDEGTACDVVHLQSCPCQPKSCGPKMCGTLPDGCGNVIDCGACP